MLSYHWILLQCLVNLNKPRYWIHPIGYIGREPWLLCSTDDAKGLSAFMQDGRGNKAEESLDLDL